MGTGDATLLTTVDQIDPLYVNFTMSSSDLQSLRQAQRQGNVDLAQTDDTTVKLMLSTGQTYDQLGTLDFSDVAVDPATGAVSLRATVPNPQRVLLPGSFVTVRVNMGTRSNVFLVPQAAIQRDTQGAYAMVVGQDGKVTRKNVQMEDIAIDNQWVITDGLKAGDQVIALGLQKAREGGQVKAIPYEQAKAQAAQAAQAQQQQGGAGGQPPAAAGAGQGGDKPQGQAPAPDAKGDDAQQPASGQAQ